MAMNEIPATGNDEFVQIIAKFAESGWDLIETPSKAWLKAKGDSEKSKALLADLLTAVEQADNECGSCGCEYDPLYKKALAISKNLQ